ncbi:MAG: penicillin-binding protein activator LpoB [Patescibacteria group bacterium]|nr:penicillin-binding protein activator LpoB [Patescibacteria group bacterium]
MRTLVIVFLAMVIAVGIFSPAFAAEKPRVAVIVFDVRPNKDWSGWGTNRPIDDIIQLANGILSKTEKFQIPNRNLRQETWTEQDLLSTGRMDPATVARKGKTVGAELLLNICIRSYGLSSAGAIAVPFKIDGRQYGVGHGGSDYKLTLSAELVDVATSTTVWPLSGSPVVFEGVDSESVNLIGSEFVNIIWGTSSSKAAVNALTKIANSLVSDFLPSYQPAAVSSLAQNPSGPVLPADPVKTFWQMTNDLIAAGGNGERPILFFNKPAKLGSRWIIVSVKTAEPWAVVEVISSSPAPRFGGLVYEVKVIGGNVPTSFLPGTVEGYKMIKYNPSKK